MIETLSKIGLDLKIIRQSKMNISGHEGIRLEDMHGDIYIHPKFLQS
jgi:hypothetical protein